MQDFKGLANALQSGDISSAQNAFRTLLNDLQQTGKTSQLLDKNTEAGKDFQALQDALTSGDIKAAQDAFKTLKTDLHSARRAHHHHRAANDGDAVDGESNPAPAVSASASATNASAEQVPSTLDAVA